MLRQSLSCSQETSSFDETITEPALCLPTGSWKVLFVTGCWKGHSVLLPLLFLACALSPSERGSAPVPWTPDTPSPCGCIPDALAPEACGRAAGRMLSACPHAARAGWALYGPEKLLRGSESCVQAWCRQLQPRCREIVNFGMQAAYVMLLESPCCQTCRRGVWPQVSQHRRVPKVGGLKQPVPCLAEGCSGERGSGGTLGSAEPSPRGWHLGHTHAGRLAAARGSRHSCTGWAGTRNEREGHRSTGKARAVGCSCVLMVPSKNREQKGNNPTNNSGQKEEIHPENCASPKHCFFFFPSSGKYPNICLSSCLLDDQADWPRGALGFLATVAWDHSGPRSACIDQLTCVQGVPETLCTLGRAAADPYCHPLHPSAS